MYMCIYTYTLTDLQNFNIQKVQKGIRNKYSIKFPFFSPAIITSPKVITVTNFLCGFLEITYVYTSR